MQFINNYRGIAILLIVLIHAVGTVSSHGSVVLISINLLLENATILFVVVAGYLFSLSSGNFNYFEFLKHKFFTIIVPYFFVSIPAILLYMTGLKDNHYWIDMDWFHSLSMPSQYLYLMGSGAHLVTFWFIPMIVPLYLCSPLILYLKDKGFLTLLFCLSLLPAVWFGRPEFSENNLVWTLYFLPAYLFGMLLAQRPQLYTFIQKYSAYLLVVYLAIYLSMSWSVAFSSSQDLFFKMLLSLLLIAFAKQYLDKRNKWLNMFARLSFYLFFIHGYFIAAIRMLYQHYFDAPMNGLFAATTSFSVTLICSIALFIMIKLTLKERSKVFIGI